MENLENEEIVNEERLNLVTAKFRRIIKEKERLATAKKLENTKQAAAKAKRRSKNKAAKNARKAARK